MIEFVLKVTLGILLFYAFYLVFLAKESMFGFTRFFLLFALCFSLVVPFIPLPFSFQIQNAVVANGPGLASTVIENRIQDNLPDQNIAQLDGRKGSLSKIQGVTQINWGIVLKVIYLLGLSIFLARFISQLGMLLRSIRNNLTLQEGEVTYVLLPKNALPFTFLHFIFVDKSAFQNKAIEEEIIYHELTHIRQKHSWDILFVEVLKIVFWFNPLLFLYKKAIQLNHEFLADAAVNSKFRNKAAYQWLLFNKIPGNEVALSISSPFNASVTKRRVIMMGQSSSPLKTKLYKASSLVLTGFMLMFLSSSKTYFSAQYPEPVNKYEKILSQAFKAGNPYEVDLAKLDLLALRNAYLALDDKEKESCTEFPFFDALAFEKLTALHQAYPKVKISFLFKSPPQINEIPNDLFERWKDTKSISLTIDGKATEKAELENYQAADFALFTVRETEKKDLFKKPQYQIILFTQAYYSENYLKPRKKIEIIQAEYPSEVRIVVPFEQYYAETKDGQTAEGYPENYEASVFHQLSIIDPSQLRVYNSKLLNYTKSTSFSIILEEEGKPMLITKLPSI
ncbi:M56 family metallopeptidase [Algoriphagus sp.]|uniref:M56 family metallopeptidase n=1 Tax=Algoriphagus sp. TaxID=1872435 RepID=UPI003F6EE77B